MNYILSKILGRKIEKTPKNDFSEFFNNASAREKKKLFKEVIRQANEDQRAIVEDYEKAR